MNKKFTATYLDIENANFIVSNISDAQIHGTEHSVFCVLNNLLQRGLPVKPSFKLAQKFSISENDTLYNVDKVLLNRTTATIRLQLTLLQLLMNGTLSIYDTKWSFAIKTVGAKDYEQMAVDDLFYWLEMLCILADIDFKRPKVEIFSVENFENSGYEEFKIYMDIENSSIEAEEYDVVYVLSMYDQKTENCNLEVSNPIDYTFAKNIAAKTDALRGILKNLFGFDDFRPGQENIIINALKRKDTIGVLPTGSGKSICYQICALLQPCISICISPIKSLMIDQCQNLKDVGIDRVAYISSDLTGQDRKEVMKNFRDYRYLLIYIAPERFQHQGFRNILADMRDKDLSKYGYIIIDEVHCMSEWGHSFRTSYLNLVKTARKYCIDAVLLGLTATASENVLRNIKIEFGMKDSSGIVSVPHFTREELEFKVINVNEQSNKYNELNKILESYMYYHEDLLDDHSEEANCGIIFTPFSSNRYRYGAARLADDLSKKYDKDIRCYAGTKPKGWEDYKKVNWEDYKRKAQDDFKDNKFNLIVATKAFGTGIDKRNVRYTIHYGIPVSLESLYQEAGRAGRDKKQAQCIVLYDKEKPKEREEINKVLEDNMSSVKVLKETAEKFKFQGEDLSRQLSLFAKDTITYIDEMKCAKKILRRIKNGIRRIEEFDGFSHEIIEKVVYHLSIIGIIEDWTVNWVKKEINVIPVENFTFESVLQSANDYIKNYGKEFEFRRDDPFIVRNEQNYEDMKELLVLGLYYEWYNQKILSYRKQSLINVAEACDQFEEKGAEAFKQTLESYFTLSDITILLANIADETENYLYWFNIFDAAVKEKKSDREMTVILARFLESFQNNVAINLISGMYNLLANNFDSLNGRQRFIKALEVINEYHKADKEAILVKLLDVIASKENMRLKMAFSEFIIHNMDVENIEKIVFKRLEDHYSLKVCLAKQMAQMADYIGEV